MHTAIDPAQREGFKSVGLLNIDRAGLDRQFRFFELNSYEILPRLLAQGERFDFIFIDGMHVYDYVLVDFFFADLLLKPKGYIMFDDLWMPSIRPAVMYVLRNRHYQMNPHWIWNRKPLIRQFWNFIRTDKRRKFKIKIMLRHQLWRPLDVSPAFFALKGSLRFQVFQKIAEDDRPWYYHREF